jgi:hypothetical protein
MIASLRDLGTHAGAVPAPQLDVAALVRSGESRIRRRRLATVALVTAAVLVVVGGALLAAPDTRDAQPPPAGPDRAKDGDLVKTRPASRLLTYAVGATIHWGDTTIDVRAQANSSPGWGKLVDYVDATDDGAVFVTGPAMIRDAGGIGAPYGPAAVWFTDGSTPVRIGTTFGSRVRGFGIAPTAAGSTLAWIDPGTKTVPGALVVYDTARMKELARFGTADPGQSWPFPAGSAVPLAVYDDAVYWSPDGRSCEPYLWGAAYGCKPTARVMRFDTASGQQTRVSTAGYDADRRARPGLLTGRSGDPQVRRGVMFLSFVRHGDRLVARGTWEAAEPGFPATVALTGQPLRLRHPSRHPRREAQDDPHVLTLTQWLGPDRVVLLDGYDDGTDLVICRLSTGGCRVSVRITAEPFTAPGPAVSHG